MSRRKIAPTLQRVHANGRAAMVSYLAGDARRELRALLAVARAAKRRSRNSAWWRTPEGIALDRALARLDRAGREGK